MSSIIMQLLESFGHVVTKTKVVSQALPNGRKVREGIGECNRGVREEAREEAREDDTDMMGDGGVDPNILRIRT